MAHEPANPDAPSASASTSGDSADEAARAGDVPATLARVEKILREIRSDVEFAARHERHREFSSLPLVGAAVQALVLGLLALVLLDWLFQNAIGDLLIKLGVAILLQLIALTAFVGGRLRE